MTMPYGLEFVLVLAALAFVVLVACAVPVVFELRRRIIRSSVLKEELKSRVDFLFDEYRRTTRTISDLATGVDRFRARRPGA